MGLTECLTRGCLESEEQASKPLASYYRQTCAYKPSADGNRIDDGSIQEEVVRRLDNEEDDRQKLYTLVGAHIDHLGKYCQQIAVDWIW